MTRTDTWKPTGRLCRCLPELEGELLVALEPGQDALDPLTRLLETELFPLWLHAHRAHAAGHPEAHAHVVNGNDVLDHVEVRREASRAHTVSFRRWRSTGRAALEIRRLAR